MKNSDQWHPTKYIQSAGSCTASPNVACVSLASRSTASLAAKAYENSIRKHLRGKLLDLGCGNAPLYGLYRDFATQITCVDWPNSAHDTKYADVLADLNEPLPFANYNFDTVLLTDVLEHIAEPASLLQEISRILVAGGKLILGVPFLYGLHEEPYDYGRYTEFALRRMLENVELSVIELEAYGGAPDVLVDLSAKTLTFFPDLPSRVFLKLHNSLSRLLLALPPVKKLSNATRTTMPLGYCIVAQKLRT